MKVNDDITAVILAGGKSSRMGTDKGLMNFNGKEMIRHVIDAVKPHFNKLFIVANSSEYMKFGYPVHQDLLKESGPIGGIYTALKVTTSPWILIVACDMPFIKFEIIQRLIETIDVNDLVMPVHDGKREPLCAIYNQSCLPTIESQIEAGNYKLQDLAELLNSKFVDIETVDPGINPFQNLNSLQDINLPHHK